MTLVSALEDLQKTTLRAISGGLRKLEYVAGLRDQEGNYKHWGLARVYGDVRSGDAMADAHRALLSNVLSTPMRNLEKDVEQSSKEAGVPSQAYLERLSAASSELLPPNPGAGSGRHLNSILLALLSLLKSGERGANPPV